MLIDPHQLPDDATDLIAQLHTEKARWIEDLAKRDTGSTPTIESAALGVGAAWQPYLLLTSPAAQIAGLLVTCADSPMTFYCSKWTAQCSIG